MSHCIYFTRNPPCFDVRSRALKRVFPLGLPVRGTDLGSPRLNTSNRGLRVTKDRINEAGTYLFAECKMVAV